MPFLLPQPALGLGPPQCRQRVGGRWVMKRIFPAAIEHQRMQPTRRRPSSIGSSATQKSGHKPDDRTRQASFRRRRRAVAPLGRLRNVWTVGLVRRRGLHGSGADQTGWLPPPGRPWRSLRARHPCRSRRAGSRQHTFGADQPILIISGIRSRFATGLPSHWIREVKRSCESTGVGWPVVCFNSAVALVLEPLRISFTG